MKRLMRVEERRRAKFDVDVVFLAHGPRLKEIRLLTVVVYIERWQCVITTFSFCLFSSAGALQITNSMEGDMGKYECVAENTVGTEYSQSMTLFVKGKSARTFRTPSLTRNVRSEIWCMRGAIGAVTLEE